MKGGRKKNAVRLFPIQYDKESALPIGISINHHFSQIIHTIALRTDLEFFFIVSPLRHVIGKKGLFQGMMTKTAFLHTAFHNVQRAVFRSHELYLSRTVSDLLLLRHLSIHPAEHGVFPLLFPHQILRTYRYPACGQIKACSIKGEQLVIHLLESLFQNLYCFPGIVCQHVEMTAARINKVCP